MSDYEHGRLYLYERDGETRQAFRVEVDCEGAWFEPADGKPLHGEPTNVRPAIVLDPQDEDVQAFVEAYSGAEHAPFARLVADKIAAQITPPKPVMEEPTEWGAKVTDDRADWIRAHGVDKGWYAPGDDVWDNWASMINPRPYEGVRDGD